MMTIVATTSSPPTAVGPLTLDHDGVDICVHLDPGSFTRASFSVDSPPEAGSAASIAGRLEDSTFASIADGTEVTVGTNTSMEIDWMPPAGTTTDVVVWLHAVSAAATTTVQMSYFDPLD
jgi:hypothetical protein